MVLLSSGTSVGAIRSAADPGTRRRLCQGRSEVCCIGCEHEIVNGPLQGRRGIAGRVPDLTAWAGGGGPSGREVCVSGTVFPEMRYLSTEAGFADRRNPAFCFGQQIDVLLDVGSMEMVAGKATTP